MADVIEVSPSGRAKCRGCKETIPKGEVRFGEAFESSFSSGEGLRYWHLLCAAKDRRMAGKLRSVLGTSDVPIPNRSEVEEALKGGGKGKGGADVKEYPYAEAAPTGRAKCMECDETLPKGALRVAVERETETPTGMTVRGAGYLHPSCALLWAEEQEQDLDAFKKAIIANSTLDEAQKAVLAVAFADDDGEVDDDDEDDDEFDDEDFDDDDEE